MLRWLTERVNIWVVLASMLVAGGLIAVFALLVILLPTPITRAAEPPAALTVIVAPTQTPVPTRPDIIYTLTATNAPVVGGISVGKYVQITGTEGVGLRLRAGPGTNSEPRFLGMDSEVFRVKDGPKTADNYTWWFLEAPYDPNRSGWAAANYLKVVDATPAP